MRTTKPCYAIVVPCDGRDGEGRPMVLEGYLDADLSDVMAAAQRLKKTFGDVLVVELPIRLRTETIRVAGDHNKVFEVEDEDEPKRQLRPVNHLDDVRGVRV